MSSSKIPELENKRQGYVNRISRNQIKIRNYERAYESLSRFKTVVEHSQEDFHSINSGKSTFLSELEGVKQNSRTAQKYYTGMEYILLGIGSKIVDVVYTALLRTISIRLNSYVSSVNDWDDDITYCERKIRAIDQQIEEERIREEVERAALGGGM